jgi:hypothetical protein
MRVTFAVLVASSLCASSFAADRSWYGSLVDANCFNSEQANVSKNDVSVYASQNFGQIIRYCSPTSKTESFELVQPDNSAFKLTEAGNAKAAELVEASGKLPFRVTVHGALTHGSIHVESISTGSPSTSGAAPGTPDPGSPQR